MRIGGRKHPLRGLEGGVILRDLVAAGYEVVQQVCVDFIHESRGVNRVALLVEFAIALIFFRGNSFNRHFRLKFCSGDWNFAQIRASKLSLRADHYSLMCCLRFNARGLVCAVLILTGVGHPGII